MKKYQIVKTKTFNKWFDKLPKNVISRINLRLERVAEGNFGDSKCFKNICELRFDFSQGYSIYYAIQEQKIIILLLGGDKKSQDDDIKKAEKMLKQLR